MISRLRRWFGRSKKGAPPGRNMRPGEPVETPGSPTGADSEVFTPPLSGGELSLRYCSGLFHADRYTNGEITAPEKAWIRDRRELVASDEGSFSALVPRLPVVVPKLMAVLRDPDQAHSREIAGLIETDPVLAGNVLKVVNSPLMRVRSRNIENLEQAVTMLGSRGMREVVAAATISPLANFGRDSRLNEEILGQIWPETLQTAMNVKLGAEALDLADHGFALYMAGLAHSSGLLVLLRGLDRLETPEVSPGFVTELESLARVASARIAHGWDFGNDAVQLLEAWAKDDRSSPARALLTDAIAFTRIHGLCNRGQMEARACEAFRHTLPGYAENWTA